MKFAAFTQENWNSAGIDMQKMLQLESLKKTPNAMGRKQSKENNTSKAAGGGGQNNMLNNLVFAN